MLKEILIRDKRNSAISKEIICTYYTILYSYIIQCKLVLKVENYDSSCFPKK